MDRKELEREIILLEMVTERSKLVLHYYDQAAALKKENEALESKIKTKEAATNDN